MPRKKAQTIISDWEGPWVTADHAFEITKRGIPNGDKLFAVISEYDDYLAYIKRKPGYEPGDTLSLIAPFLVAFDVKDELLLEVAIDNSNFIAGSLQAIQYLRERYDLHIVSTSYCQYVSYSTGLAGIRPQKINCTKFPIDGLSKKVSERDKEFVKQNAEKFLAFDALGISANSKDVEISKNAKETVAMLDQFFWEELPKTTFKEVIERIRPLGGHRKLKALLSILNKCNLKLDEAVAIGDSITDWVMLKKIKESGGLSISFNGNDYAINNATLAIISRNCLVTPLIVDLFFRSGIEKTRDVAKNWSMETIAESVRRGDISPEAFQLFSSTNENSSEEFPSVVWIDRDNIESTTKKSKEMRKLVRGKAIGSLG